MSLTRNKFKNAKVVTMGEDYKSKKGTVILKKGTTHVMSKVTATKIKERGAKVTIKDLDAEKLINQRKKEFEENEK